MIRINLLAANPGAPAPRVWIPPEQRSAVMGLAMLVCTALGVAGWWYYQHALGKSIDARVTAIQAELVRLKQAAKLVDETAARKTELSERLALIERLQAAKRGPVTLLETVSRSIPDGLWLLELKQTGRVVQVEGRAMSLTSVTDFAEAMQNSGVFVRPVEILTTVTEMIEETSLVRFSVKAEAIAKDPPAEAAPPPPPAKPQGRGV